MHIENKIGDQKARNCYHGAGYYQVCYEEKHSG